MKRMICAAAAMLLMSTATMAQEETKQEKRPRMDRTELIQKRTNDMAQKYGLNKEQTQQLLSLNTKYAEKMRGPRGHRPQGRPGGRQESGSHPQRAGQARPQDGVNMKAYDEELQKILTPDQYKAFSEDRAKRMKDRGHRFGQRPVHPQDK